MYTLRQETPIQAFSLLIKTYDLYNKIDIPDKESVLKKLPIDIREAAKNIVYKDFRNGPNSTITCLEVFNNLLSGCSPGMVVNYSNDNSNGMFLSIVSVTHVVDTYEVLMTEIEELIRTGLVTKIVFNNLLYVAATPKASELFC